MYRVRVFTSGKYNNVCPGNRYCLRRKAALELANLFASSDCNIKVERLVHNGEVFFWSDGEWETGIGERWEDDKTFYCRVKKDEL